MYQAVISSWGKEDGHLPQGIGLHALSSRPLLQGRSPCPAFSETPKVRAPGPSFFSRPTILAPPFRRQPRSSGRSFPDSPLGPTHPVPHSIGSSPLLTQGLPDVTLKSYLSGLV